MSVERTEHTQEAAEIGNLISINIYRARILVDRLKNLSESKAIDEELEGIDESLQKALQRVLSLYNK